MTDPEIEEMRMAFVGVWDFIGRQAPRLFDEIKILKAELKAANEHAAKTFELFQTTNKMKRDAEATIGMMRGVVEAAKKLPGNWPGWDFDPAQSPQCVELESALARLAEIEKEIAL